MEEGTSSNLPRIRVNSNFTNKHLSTAKVGPQLHTEFCSRAQETKELREKPLVYVVLQVVTGCEVYESTKVSAVQPAILGAQETESHYVVSPSTPLLSTAIDENSLICGEAQQLQLGLGKT